MIKNGFKFKKNFGQNFIFDTNFLTKMVGDFSIPKNSNILEIGAGMGTLTQVLCKNFFRVVSFEIDKTLTEKLKEIENENSNLKVFIQDILKVQTKEIENFFDGEKFFVVANIPYYITSPIIFKFLKSNFLDTMFIMVQKEVGVRFSSKEGSRDYGIPSAVLGTFCDVEIVKNVPRKMFTPMPNIESCVLKIKKTQRNANLDIKEYENFVSGCFRMKRKTLINNLLKMQKEKNEILSVFEKIGLSSDIRPEKISSENYVKLFGLLQK